MGNNDERSNALRSVHPDLCNPQLPVVLYIYIYILINIYIYIYLGTKITVLV